ncbi:MAG: ATP-dependent helicase [Bacillota bacterium]
MITLRPGQVETAAYRGGYLAVPAVPGAGKTTVLAYLGAELIAGGHTGDGKILIVTYMNSSVANFKSRLAGELERRGLPPGRGYEVKTLHSLAVAIIKERPDRLLISDELRILEPVERERLIRNQVRGWLGENRELWESVVALRPKEPEYSRKNKLARWEQKTSVIMSHLVSYFKCLGLTAEAMIPLVRELPPESFLGWAAEVYRRYQDELVYQGVQDFDDLIYNACSLLKADPELLARLRQRWTYVFEDEAQDSNLLQEQMLYLLAGDGGNLVRVGDSNQAIMGTFTVADPSLFRAYCRRDQVTVQPLLYSSRSSQDIINLANHLVTWTRSRHPVPGCRSALEEQYIQPVPPGDPCPNPAPRKYTIVAVEFKDNRAEAEMAARFAGRYAADNPDKTVAILGPDRYVLENIAVSLEAAGIPCKEIAGNLNERRRTARALGAVVDFLAHPHDPRKLAGALGATIMPDLADEEHTNLRRFIQTCRPEELLYPLAGEADYSGAPAEIKKSALWPTLLHNLERVKTWLGASRIPPESLLLFLAGDLGLEEEELAIAQRIALEIKDLLRKNPAWRLADLANQLQSSENIFDYFINMIYDRKGFNPEPGVVNLSTYHRAKGLEWDTVYLTSLTAGKFPSLLRDKYQDDLWFLQDNLSNPAALAKAELKAALNGKSTLNPIEEAKQETISERLRLLYVAVTRAKENLMLCCPAATIGRETGKRQKNEAALALTALKHYIREQNPKLRP